MFCRDHQGQVYVRAPEADHAQGNAVEGRKDLAGEAAFFPQVGAYEAEDCVVRLDVYLAEFLQFCGCLGQTWGVFHGDRYADFAGGDQVDGDAVPGEYGEYVLKESVGVEHSAGFYGYDGDVFFAGYCLDAPAATSGVDPGAVGQGVPGVFDKDRDG